MAKRIRKKTTNSTQSQCVEEHHPQLPHLPPQPSSQQAGPSTTSSRQSQPKSFPGGPEDNSTLIHYEHHCARQIWETAKTRSIIKVHHHYESIDAKWHYRDECSKFQSAFRQSGLVWVVDCMFKHIDKAIVSALIERWYPETNTFHFPWGEMTITPHDVSSLFHLDVVGRPVKGGKLERKDVEPLIFQYLGIEKEEWEEIYDSKQGLSIPLWFLRDKFKGKATNEMDDKTLHLHVRAYIMYVLGNTIIPAKSGSRVSLSYIANLVDIRKIKEFAWGTATLTFLFRQLGLASRQACAQITGYMTLLEVWFYEYFPCFVTHVTIKTDWTIECQEPRAKKYVPIGVDRKQEDVISIRRSIDNLSHEQIKWNPYGNVEIAEFSFFRGILFAYDIMEAYHPDRVLRQLGYEQPVPLNPFVPITAIRNAKSTEYKVIYEICHQFQENWRHCTLDRTHFRELRSNVSNVYPNYMGWYRRHSHPVVHPGAPVGVNDPKWQFGVDNAIREIRVQLQRCMKCGDIEGIEGLKRIMTHLFGIECYKRPFIPEPERNVDIVNQENDSLEEERQVEPERRTRSQAYKQKLRLESENPTEPVRRTRSKVYKGRTQGSK